MKQKRVKSIIHRIQTQAGNWLNEKDTIANEAVKFFSALFSTDHCDFSTCSFEGILPKIVATQDNEKSKEIPSTKEVKQVVFDMDGESVAGLNGFIGKFFTLAWEIIGEDIHKAIVSFFCGAELPKFVTSSSIVQT